MAFAEWRLTMIDGNLKVRNRAVDLNNRLTGLWSLIILTWAIEWSTAATRVTWPSVQPSGLVSHPVSSANIRPYANVSWKCTYYTSSSSIWCI
jgi:hypothetical protein